MANEGYHEPVEELTDETRDMHRAITSLMEELEAVDWYNQRVDACKDKELAARASFLLGQVQETLGNYEAAFEGYSGVRDYSAPYELDYAARYSAVRVDGLYLNPERALRDVRKLERDDKNVVKTAELRFLRARILQQAGGVDQAMFIYDELLYDPLALPPQQRRTRCPLQLHLAGAVDLEIVLLQQLVSLFRSAPKSILDNRVLSDPPIQLVTIQIPRLLPVGLFRGRQLPQRRHLSIHSQNHLPGDSGRARSGLHRLRVEPLERDALARPIHRQPL